MAIFEFTDTSFIEAFWSVWMRNQRGDLYGDLLAVLYRDTADAPWQLTARYRLYLDDQTWNSKDKKMSYTITAKTDPASDAAAASLGQQMDGFAANLSPDPTCRTKVVVHGNQEAFVRLFRPFAHSMVLPKEPERPQ